jgi:hypothetical protein
MRVSPSSRFIGVTGQRATAPDRPAIGNSKPNRVVSVHINDVHDHHRA